MAERKDFSLPDPPAPKYPYGLRITLGKEELKKINMQGTPEIGKKIKAEIVMEVVEISAENKEGDEKDYRIELQIKEMELKKDKEENSGVETSQIIYGD